MELITLVLTQKKKNYIFYWSVWGHVKKKCEKWKLKYEGSENICWNLFKNFIFKVIFLATKKKKKFNIPLVRTYVFHLLGIYVTTLWNWLILWQNVLYLYLGRFKMCLNTSRNYVSRSSVEAFKSVQENKLIVQIH